MLIEIQGDYGASLSASERESIERLAASGVYGQHAVYAKRPILDWLSAQTDLSEAARSYFLEISQKITQFGSHIFPFKALRVFFHPADRGDIWEISISDLSHSQLLERSQLLAENLTDCRIISKFSKAYLHSRMQGFLEYSIRIEHGGGSTTAQVLEHLASEKCGPTLCIADSDRRIADGALGATAKACTESYKKLKSWRTQLYILKSRELENIVPIDLLLEASGLDRETQISLRNLRSSPSEFSQFCSIKSGDSACMVSARALEKDRGDVAKSINEVTVAGLPRCGCSQDNSCYSFPGLGDSILSKTDDRLTPEIAEVFLEELHVEFEELIAQAAIHGMAFPPKRV